MGLLRVIKKEDHNSAKIVQILNLNKQIKFVSLMGVDLGGNATDEKIPVELFKKDIDDFLYRGIQTDGSSVELHEIATLNNAKVDLLPDLDVNWYIDYNFCSFKEKVIMWFFSPPLSPICNSAGTVGDFLIQ